MQNLWVKGKEKELKMQLALLYQTVTIKVSSHTGADWDMLVAVLCKQNVCVNQH